MRKSRNKSLLETAISSPVVRALVAVLATVAAAAVFAGAVLLVGEIASLALRSARGSTSGALTRAGGESGAIVVFLATYLVMAIGKLPGYRLDRAGAALLGASLMVGIGAISLDEAYKAIDFDTITLLLGMMIVVGNLRLSGFFALVNNWAVTRAHHPLALLFAIILVAGVFSAFLVNDAICLVMTPLVLDLVLRLKRDPIPYLLAVPMASNIGSVATITGNPQNMIVGSLSHISYGAFAGALWPVAGAGLAMTAALIAVAYRKEFLTPERFPPLRARPIRYHPALAAKAVVVTVAMMIFFFLGQPVAKVAIVGGALLLFTRRVKAEKVYREIDWPLLLMFVGLFVVVAALEREALGPETIGRARQFDFSATPTLSLITAALSNLVSNVPAVLLLKPFVAEAPDPQRAWLVVAMASTLAGNFTLIGSIANLIVAERARAKGVALGFWTYFRVGAPLTAFSILFGIRWL